MTLVEAARETSAAIGRASGAAKTVRMILNDSASASFAYRRIFGMFPNDRTAIWFAYRRIFGFFPDDSTSAWFAYRRVFGFFPTLTPSISFRVTRRPFGGN